MDVGMAACAPVVVSVMSCVALGKAHTLSEPPHSPDLWVLETSFW